MNDFSAYFSLLLIESQNYEGMFKSLDISPSEYLPYITWARKVLKKNDRIVWFLRWVNYHLAVKFGAKPEDVLASMNKRLGTKYTKADVMPIRQIEQFLEHFSGIPSRKLQQVVYDRQTPAALFDVLSAIETEWKGTANDDEGAEEMARQQRLVQMDPDDKVIMRFPDGYAWVDLQKPHCGDEAKAMGHCGNSPGKWSNDTILSLRKAVIYRGEKWWYPVCTFILDDEGHLGEMKGRGNDKPKDRYHSYIVALLRSPVINGIKGGGYLPQNNFGLSDLDPEERNELVAEKPSLAQAEELYDKEGMTKRTLQAVFRGLQAQGLSVDVTYDAKNKRFQIARWSDFEYFIKDLYIDDLEEILKICLGEADFQYALDDLDSVQEFVNVVSELPNEWQAKFMERAGKPDVEQAARELAKNHDDLYEMFPGVMRTLDVVREQAWERMFEYVQAGFYFHCDDSYDNIPQFNIEELKSFVMEKKEVALYVHERAMVGFATYGADADEYYGMYDVEQNGWASFNDESTLEHYREEGLMDRKQGKSKWMDKWLKGKDFDEIDIVDHFLTALRGGIHGARIIDPLQTELSFEGTLRRMRELSGLNRL